MMFVFLVTQFVVLMNYEIHPNFTDREKVVSQILNNWSNGIRVYFKNESSFDYAYLLRWEAKQRDLDPQNIEIYEPWQPENNAELVIEDNIIRARDAVGPD